MPLVGRRRANQHEQRGETLIEVIVAVFIAGLCVVALLSGVFSLIAASVTHRGNVRSAIESTGLAEAIDQVAYVPCTAATTPDYSAVIDPSLKAPYSSGYAATIQSVEFLQSSTSATAAFGSTCPTGGDQGAQQITVNVQRSGAGVRGQDVKLVKRNDTCPSPLAATRSTC